MIYAHLLLLKGIKKQHTRLQRKHSTKKTAKLLPRPFQLPETFPEFVSKEISTGVVSGRARSRLIFTVANAVFKHTAYPSDEEYVHVASQVVGKYEFMKGDNGSHVSY